MNANGLNKRSNMTTKEKIMGLSKNWSLTHEERTEELLRLFSVSKRFNLPNFATGVIVGLVLALIIIHIRL